MSNLLWACATSGYYSAAYFDAACAAVIPHVRGFAATEVAAASWALSEVRHYDARVMDGLGDKFAAICEVAFGDTGRTTQHALCAKGA